MLQREGEAAELSTLAEETRSGTGRLLLLHGPAGSGKSLLLAAAAEIARRNGLRTVEARCSSLESGFAFGVARRLIEQLMPGASGGAGLGDVRRAPARRDLPARLDRLYRAISEAAEREPLALFVDDVQFADAPSLRFLDYMGNRIGDIPLLLVLAGSGGEPVGSQALVDAIAANPLARTMALSPLQLEAVTALVAGHLGEQPDEAFARACLEATNGNPYFLEELLGTLAADGVAPRQANAARVGEVSPPSLGREARRRLKGLSKNALDFAAAVAVLGTEVQLPLAAELAGIDLPAAASAADELIGRRLLRPSPLRYVEPIVRRAVRAELPPLRRAELHARAAQLLTGEGGHEDEAAAHLLETHPGRGEWAVRILSRAAERAHARGEPGAALAFLKRALQEVPHDGSRFDLLLALGAAELDTGTGGLGTIEQALTIAPDEDSLAAAALRLGRLLFIHARFREAAEVLERALARLDADAPLAPKLQAHLMSASLLDLSMFRRNHRRLTELARHPETIEDPLLLAAVARFTVGTAPPASRGEQLARRALAADELSPSSDPVLYALAANALMAAGATEAARQAWDDAIIRARRGGSLSALTLASTFRAHVWMRLGDVQAAEADARQAFGELGTEVTHPLPFVVAPLIDALIERGELKEAAAIAHARGFNGELPELFQLNFLLDSLGRLRLADGRAPEAIELLRECGRRMDAWNILSPGYIAWRSHLALALAEAGERDEARAVAAEELALAQEFVLPRESANAMRVLALVEDAPPLDRAERLTEAARLLEGTPAPLDRARILGDAGAALSRGGARQAAREPLREALDLSRRCGAAALEQRVYADLIATGARPRRMVLTGADSLTGSEQRVARLASEGLSNREIAGRLFVSEKTVEAHLHHVFDKLDVRSRHDLARHLASG